MEPKILWCWFVQTFTLIHGNPAPAALSVGDGAARPGSPPWLLGAEP